MKFIAAAVLAASLAACSPSLNWRELSVQGVRVQLPCKPTQQVRQLPLAGAPVTMSLQACEAEGATWAFASADVADPARLDSALDELVAAAVRNIDADSPEMLPFAVRGAATEPPARRVGLQGRRPDGKAVHSEAAVFAAGTRVYQATVVAPPSPEAAETFFSALQVLP